MKNIYLDGAANTPVDPKVRKKMEPYLKKRFYGNASAAHDYGARANIAIEKARQKMADCLCVSDKSIIFTSGATESNNTAIKCLGFSQIAEHRGKKKKGHIICGGTEHSSVLNSCKELEKMGLTVSYISPNSSGKIEVEAIKKVVNENTLLICLMAVNNELGVANPVNEVTSFAREKGIFTLIDCTQCISYGGEYIKLGELYPMADMMSFSSHKIYGPEGVGCLIVQNEKCKKIIQDFPLMSGGSQEHGCRGGTYNVPGIIGMAAAVELMADTPLKGYYEHLYNYLLNTIRGHKLPITLNANADHKNIVSLNLSQMIHSNSAASLLGICGIACSSGSACDANHDEINGDFNPSHVLTGINLSQDSIKGTIRVSFTKDTTTKDLDKLINVFEEIKNN